jgi:hypothetical protein
MFDKKTYVDKYIISCTTWPLYGSVGGLCALLLLPHRVAPVDLILLLHRHHSCALLYCNRLQSNFLATVITLTLSVFSANIFFYFYTANPSDKLYIFFIRNTMNSSKNSSSNNNNNSMQDYYIKRQKNNEAAKTSRLKKKEQEIEIAKKKQKLEITYVKLQKQINRMQSVRA